MTQLIETTEHQQNYHLPLDRNACPSSGEEFPQWNLKGTYSPEEEPMESLPEKSATPVTETSVAPSKVWDYTKMYLSYGIIGGIALKALDTTVLMFTADTGLGVMWLVLIAGIFLSGKYPLASVVVAFLSFSFGLFPFAALLSTAFIGALFGAPVGMIIGTLVGHSKLKSGLLTHQEGSKPYLLGLGIPILSLAVLIPLYIWANYQILTMLASGSPE